MRRRQVTQQANARRRRRRQSRRAGSVGPVRQGTAAPAAHQLRDAARRPNDTPEQQERRALDRIARAGATSGGPEAATARARRARLDAEELKRQLERLSREQQELRQQADALQKQSQGGGAAGRGSSSGTPDNASMQRAAEQMRNAANEMQRQNASGAAASARAGGAGSPAVSNSRCAARAPARGSERPASCSSKRSRSPRRSGASPRRWRGWKRASGPGGAAAMRPGGWRTTRKSWPIGSRRWSGPAREARTVVTRAGRREVRRRGAAAAGPSRSARGCASRRSSCAAVRPRSAAGDAPAASRRNANGSREHAAPAEQQLARALDDVASTLGGGDVRQCAPARRRARSDPRASAND